MSILVSASFLKIGELVEVALRFSHDNMNKILGVTHNLSCLGEPLISRSGPLITRFLSIFPPISGLFFFSPPFRLALLYKPSEVEDLLDRKDRIHSKLYTKLIGSLMESTPQPGREIFATAATLHRCRLCGMFLTNSLSRILPCLPLRSAVNHRGEIVPRHQRYDRYKEVPQKNEWNFSERGVVLQCFFH